MHRFHVCKRFPPRRQRPRDRPGQPRRPARGRTPGACPPRARCSPPAPPTHGEPPPPPTPGGPAGPTLHRWAGYRFYTWFKYHLLSQIFCTSLENIFNVEHRTLLSSIFFNKYFWFNKYFFSQLGERYRHPDYYETQEYIRKASIRLQGLTSPATPSSGSSRAGSSR